MEQNPHSIQDQKYPGSEYYFQAIEMANEEASSELDLDADFFSWKIVKRRQKPQRRYTVSHAAPPAPPSTPTSLSKEHDPLSELSLSMSPTEHSAGFTSNGNSSGIGNSNGHGNADYIFDYAPKYKKKLKEQQRTDTELAELFKVVTITGGGSGSGNGSGRGNGCGKSVEDSSFKSSMEHGVSVTSRKIRRPDMNAGVFKIHRNPDDTTKDLHDEDSLSAPEFEAATEENMTVARPWRRLKVVKRRRRTFHRERIHKEFEIMKRMYEVVNTFDSTMSFQSTQ